MTIMTRHWILSVGLAATFAGCGDAGPTQDAPDTADSSADTVASDADVGSDDTVAPDAGGLPANPLRGTLDSVLRLNHLQVLGTHNSYHLHPDPLLHPTHAYGHASLTAQLDLGVRAFEIDIHNPKDPVAADDFSVYHILVADEQTSCVSLRACLGELKAWSDEQPSHVPITVWVEPKGDAGGGTITDLPRLDDVIADVIPASQLLTPRDIRGTHASVRDALAADGWPLLGDARGKIMFCLLDASLARARYVGDLAQADQRIAFVRAAADELDADWAAVAKFNNPGDENIAAAHDNNLLVASNLCLAGEEDDTVCETGTTNAAANGSHWLKTDFPDPSAADAPYTFAIAPQCNPVTAPAVCDSAAIE